MLHVVVYLACIAALILSRWGGGLLSGNACIVARIYYDARRNDAHRCSNFYAPGFSFPRGLSTSERRMQTKKEARRPDANLTTMKGRKRQRAYRKTPLLRLAFYFCATQAHALPPAGEGRGRKKCEKRENKCRRKKRMSSLIAFRQALRPAGDGRRRKNAKNH